MTKMETRYQFEIDGRVILDEDNYPAILSAVAARYEYVEIGHDGDLLDGGDRTLVWSGTRVIGSIVKRF